MKYLISFFIIVILYACSTSSAGDASNADAAEEAARLSYVEPTITKVGVVPVK